MNSNFGIVAITLCISICLFTACSSRKIEITNEYVINENWSRQNEQAGANSIAISKMKVRSDSSFNPFSDLNQYEVLNKLDDDSSFTYYTNVRLKEGESYNNKKIYFDQDNGFYWLRENRNNTAEKVKTIGNLQKNNWYKFSNLGSIGIRYIVVYIDSTNNVHRFDVFHSNF